MQTRAMKLYVFAGANGSGKSTLVGDFLKKPKYKGVSYVCPDTFVKAMSDISLDITEKYLYGMDLAEKLRYALIEKRKPFCLETVLSNPDKIDFITAAKKAGYEICIIYVMTESPEVNKRRIIKRVSQGGHDVPEDKLISRYYRSLELVPRLIKVSDEFYLYDNSYENQRPKLVFCFNARYAQNPVYEKYIRPYVGV